MEIRLSTPALRQRHTGPVGTTMEILVAVDFCPEGKYVL